MRIRLGVIGCGLAVRNLHWPALRQMPDKFQIVAVCNHTPEKAREFAQLVGLNYFETDYRKLLEAREIDAILAALPIDKNAAITRDCLAAGKHVLCEKPLAHTLDEARKLRDFAKQAPVVLLVGENYYYRDDFNEAVALIRAGHIGGIFLITFEAVTEVDHTRSYGATAWRQVPAYRGGFVSDAGVHHAAALRMMGGEIRAVHALTKNVHPVIHAEDNLAATIEFVNGAIGHYLATYTAKAPKPGTRLRLFGTEGSIEVSHGELTVYRPKVSPAAETRRYADFDNGFRNEWRAFHEAICYGKTFPGTVEQCYADQAVIMAMLDSAARREVLPIQNY